MGWDCHLERKDFLLVFWQKEYVLLNSTLKMKHEDYIIKVFTPNLVLMHSSVIGAL